MRRHELKECQKIIGDHIQKATSSNTSQSTTATAAVVAQGSNNNTSPNNVNGNGNSIISPTPSPAGSEGSVCSKSSGYTSSGEQNIPPGGGASGLTYGKTAYGVLTPPTNGAAGYTPNQNGSVSANHCLSVPSQVMQKQHQFCSYLSQCHELWELADMYAARGHCKGTSP